MKRSSSSRACGSDSGRAQLRELFGVGEQGVGDVAELVGAGVVAGDQQDHRHHGELVRVQQVVAVAGGGERADQVLAGVGAALGGERGEVGAQPGLGLLLALAAARAHPHHRDGPAAQPVAVLGGDLQHFADGGEREPGGEELREVGRGAVLLHLVEVAVDDPLGGRAHPLDLAVGEALGDQAAQPVVLGRVHQVDRLGLGDGGGRHPGQVAADAGGAAEPAVGGDHLDVLVAGGQPGLTLAVRQSDPGDRGLREQPLEEGVELQAVGVVEGALPHGGGGGHGPVQWSSSCGVMAPETVPGGSGADIQMLPHGLVKMWAPRAVPPKE